MSPEIKESIIRLRAEGKSLRAIAEQLLGAKTKESTVRHILKKSEEVPMEGAKILVFDIETSPCKSYHWRRWKENIGQDQAISESYILTWAAKWLGQDGIISDTIVNYDKYLEDSEDDSSVLLSLVRLIDEADMVIAHNGKAFDIPVVKARMLYHGLQPFSPVRIIDTKIIAQKEFRLPSNALNSIAAYLGLGSKVSTGGFKLWKGCMDNDPEAWELMLTYNEQDVRLLEDVYMRLRPFDSRHPNVALYSDCSVTRCPCCGSEDLYQEEKFDSTNVSMFPVVRCNNCGKPSSTRQSVLNKDQRKTILRNTR